MNKGTRWSIRLSSGVTTFRGSHNRIKALVMQILAHNRDQAQGARYKGRCAFDLYFRLGVNYYSLHTLLSRWYAWGYVTRQYDTNCFGERVFHYKIARKGLRFLYYASELAPYKQYWADVRPHQIIAKSLFDTPGQHNRGSLSFVLALESQKA